MKLLVLGFILILASCSPYSEYAEGVKGYVDACVTFDPICDKFHDTPSTRAQIDVYNKHLKNTCNIDSRSFCTFN